MASNDIRMRVLLNVEGKNTVVEVSSSVKELQGALSEAANRASTFRERIAYFSNLSMMAKDAVFAIQGLGTAMQPLIDKANAAVVVQTKLKTVMEQRMKASQADVAGINKLVSAQTELGVVGGTVQRSGLQQVATFASHKETLETLLPAMNNLLAQQKGLNATSEDAVTIANMMGKALMGNVTALTRVGVTLTDEEKNIIRTGNEGERAAAIAKAITENVGQMNRKLAQTDAGRVKQMANEFGGLQVKIGSFFAQYQNVIAGVGQVGIAVAGVASLGSAVTGLWKGLGLATLAGKAFSVAQVSFAAMSTLVTAAVNGETLSLTALRAGIRGTIVSLGLVGIAYMALSSVIGALCEKTGLLGGDLGTAATATKSLTASERAAAAAAERERTAHASVGEAVGGVVGKFRTLQGEWKRLKTAGDQTKWIRKNQSAFADMGLSIGDVNAAQRVFVTNAPKVINALKAIATANAYSEEYGKSQVRKARAEQNGTVANGAYYRPVSGAPHMQSPALLEEMERAGVRPGDYKERTDALGRHYYTFTGGGRSKLNTLRRREASARHADYLKGYAADTDFWGGKMQSALDSAERARAWLAGQGSGAGDGAARDGKGGGRTGAGDGAARDGAHGMDFVDKELEGNRKKIEALSHEYLTAGAARKTAIQGEIAKLQERNKTIEDGIAAAKGEGKATAEKGSKKDLEARLGTLRELQDGTVAGTDKWKAYGAEIDAVEKKLDALNGTETETGKSGLNAPAIEAWRGMRQAELDSADLGTAGGMTAAVRIRADMDSMDTLRDTVEAALGNGLTLPEDAVEGLYSSIFDGGNVPDDKIQGWVDAVNGKLSAAGLGEIAIKSDGNGVKRLVEGGKEARASWKDAARAVQSVGGALAGIEDPAVKIAGTIAQAVAEIALSFAEALNKKESRAGGVWGWIAAAAAGTATMISTIASVKSATRHAGGGIVGGNTPSGDLQPVLLNSGELILNKAQQGNLAGQLQGGRAEHGGTPYVTGEEIYLGLSNYLRRRGYGEIVTTRG